MKTTASDSLSWLRALVAGVAAADDREAALRALRVRLPDPAGFFAKVFGEAEADRLTTIYEKDGVGLERDLAVELVPPRGRTRITVQTIESPRHMAIAAEVRAILRAMRRPVPVYSVALGDRFVGPWVYEQDGWRWLGWLPGAFKVEVSGWGHATKVPQLRLEPIAALPAAQAPGSEMGDTVPEGFPGSRGNDPKGLLQIGRELTKTARRGSSARLTAMLEALRIPSDSDYFERVFGPRGPSLAQHYASNAASGPGTVEAAATALAMTAELDPLHVEVVRRDSLSDPLASHEERLIHAAQIVEEPLHALEIRFGRLRTYLGPFVVVDDSWRLLGARPSLGDDTSLADRARSGVLEAAAGFGPDPSGLLQLWGAMTATGVDASEPAPTQTLAGTLALSGRELEVLPPTSDGQWRPYWDAESYERKSAALIRQLVRSVADLPTDTVEVFHIGERLPSNNAPIFMVGARQPRSALAVPLLFAAHVFGRWKLLASGKSEFEGQWLRARAPAVRWEGTSIQDLETDLGEALLSTVDDLGLLEVARRAEFADPVSDCCRIWGDQRGAELATYYQQWCGPPIGANESPECDALPLDEEQMRNLLGLLMDPRSGRGTLLARLQEGAAMGAVKVEVELLSDPGTSTPVAVATARTLDGGLQVPAGVYAAVDGRWRLVARTVEELGL